MRRVGGGPKLSKAKVAPAPRSYTEESYAPSFASNQVVFPDKDFFTRENVEDKIDQMYSNFRNNNPKANIRNPARRLELEQATEQLNEEFGEIFYERNWGIVTVPKNAKMSTLLKSLIDDSRLPVAPETRPTTFAEDMRQFELTHPEERTHVYQYSPEGLSARRMSPDERTMRNLPVASLETEGMGRVRRCGRCGLFR